MENQLLERQRRAGDLAKETVARLLLGAAAAAASPLDGREGGGGGGQQAGSSSVRGRGGKKSADGLLNGRASAEGEGSRRGVLREDRGGMDSSGSCTIRLLKDLVVQPSSEEEVGVDRNSCSREGGAGGEGGGGGSGETNDSDQRANEGGKEDLLSDDDDDEMDGCESDKEIEVLLASRWKT